MSISTHRLNNYRQSQVTDRKGSGKKFYIALSMENIKFTIKF